MAVNNDFFPKLHNFWYKSAFVSKSFQRSLKTLFLYKSVLKGVKMSELGQPKFALADVFGKKALRIVMEADLIIIY